MNVKNKSLIVFSENYPYEGGEQFFVNDLYYLSGKFSKLYVFPTKEKNKQIIERKPDNLVPLKAISANSNVKNLFSNWRLTLSMLYCEVVLNKKRIYFLKNLKYFLSIFSETIEMENIFQKNLKVEGVVEDDVFLSLWMNKYTLMLSISKYKNHIKDFSFRINGVDIFNERNKGGYLPFERFNYKQSKRVIINSKFSYNYKEKQNLYVDKLDYNYYSIDDYGLNPVNEDNVFHIVSCSNLIPLKRVKLIQEALMFADFKVKWTHFGDGSERKIIEDVKMNSNVEMCLKGSLSNSEIVSFYKQTPINVFLHVSESEGLGYSIFEALNFGIPCIVCDSGGVSDLVNDSNGKLLPVDIKAELIYQEILNFKNSFKNSLGFKEKVKAEFKSKYDKEKLIDKLYSLIQ